MRKTIMILMVATVLFASSVEVSVIKPKLSKQSLTIEADGVVVAENKNVITSKANGTVKLFIHNNFNVFKGDKIAQIVDERREQKLKLLKAKLALVKKEMKAQEAKLANAKDMYKMGVGSKNGYLNEQVLNEQFKESFQTIKNDYKILKQEQKNAIIYAPEDGTITNLADLNSYISYGTTIATFISKKSAVKLFVDAIYAKKLRVGTLVNIQSSYKNTTATIVNVLPTSTNNLLEVMARPKDTLPLNLRISANIELEYLSGITLPKSAIVLIENHPAVYIIKDGVAHIKYVEILKDMVNKILIKNTLDKQSQIAVKNSYMLHDGLAVDVVKK